MYKVELRIRSRLGLVLFRNHRNLQQPAQCVCSLLVRTTAPWSFIPLRIVVLIVLIRLNRQAVETTEIAQMAVLASMEPREIATGHRQRGMPEACLNIAHFGAGIFHRL